MATVPMSDTPAPGPIDADLHSAVPNAQALFPYLNAYWRETMTETAFKGPPHNPYPANAPTSARPGSKPESGPPGSDLALMRTQALDPYGTEIGILNCSYGIESIHNPDGAAALAAAVNDWHRAEWLDREPRLRASILVPSRQPEMAAAEIERVAGDSRFVQVYLPVRSEAPYGNRRYHALFAAAAKHDLTIGLHFGGATGQAPTSSGWPSYYIEEVAGMAQIFQSQIFSMIAEGLFDRFPTLRVTCIEGGWTWLPSLMWRVDKEWKGLRREVPWVRKLPSDYMREHCRFTTLPHDCPDDPAQTRQVMAQMDAADLLLFATDYPHWHGDSDGDGDNRTPDILPVPLTEDERRKILRDNALAWYPRLGQQ